MKLVQVSIKLVLVSIIIGGVGAAVV